MLKSISCLEHALRIAARGERVLWVDNHIEIREIVRAVDVRDPRVDKVYRSNGRERVLVVGGGSIIFAAEGGSPGRGVQADALFVSMTTYENKERLANIIPSFQTSKAYKATGEPYIIVLPGRGRCNVA